MHVVVTGAAGFVGGRIAKALATRGFEVTAIARRPCEDATASSLTWRAADLTDRACLPASFDAMVHCAAELPSRTSDPDALYRLNATMARNVFDGARAAGARSIVFLSSMSVYGRISVPEVREDTPPDAPDAYGRAKRDAEDLLAGVIDGGLASGLSIRLPGTVGKGSHHNFLSDALTRVLAGETITAQNPEALFNNIVYVGDLAAFLTRWLAEPRPGYAVTNLAAEQPLSLREVIRTLFTLARRPERVKFVSTTRPAFLISVEQARALGYCPPTVWQSLNAFVRDCLGDGGVNE
jgi:nucleoside-diphosphate-sugar epimerase